MAFRHRGKEIHRWRTWVERQRELIAQAKLPYDVVQTESAFRYLLIHGYNQAGFNNREPWFELSSLTQKQCEHFLVLLDQYDLQMHYESARRCDRVFIPGLGTVDRKLETDRSNWRSLHASPID